MMVRSCLAVAVIALLAGAAACHRPAPPATDGRPDFGGDFTLIDTNGQTFELSQLRGKAVLLFFGYTFCPDMCPMTMAHVLDVMKRLGPARAEVVPVFITLDPPRDTPPVVKAFVSHFGPEVIGLTGSPPDIARVARQYHVSYTVMDGSTKDYLINHTTAIFLIDRQGGLRNYVAYNEPTDRLVAAVQAVLQDR
jgi:protein SCO1/2